MNQINTHTPHEQVVVLDGSLDAPSMHRIRETFSNITGASARQIILDLSSIDSMDASGVGAVTYLFKRLKMGRKTLTIKGAHGQPADLIRLLQLDKTIEIHFTH